MDHEQLVRKLTREGVLITPDVMEDIKAGKYNQTKTEKQTKSKTKLSVKVLSPKPMERLSPKDFTTYFNNRFSCLRDLLIKKAPSISINKAVDGQDVSVIGMVRERSTQGFVLEDVTGEIPVVSSDIVRDDDVISVSGKVIEGKLIASDVYWPDIPLTNQPKRILGMNILLATEIDDSLKGMIDDFDLVFVKSNGISNPKTFTNIPSPATISINKEGNGISILVYAPPQPINPKDAIGLLKRRHLMPEKKEISSTTDHFFINDIPEIFWVISNVRHVEHYKGVTLVMSKKHDSLKVDCETGEVYFSQENNDTTRPEQKQ